MIAKNLIKNTAIALALVASSISCSKKNDGEPQPASSAPNKHEIIAKNLKNLKFSFSEAGSGNINFNPTNNTFEYVEPTTGNTYSQPVSGSNFSKVVPTFSANISAGGGSFKLGSKTVDLSYVVCINAKDTEKFSKDFDGLFTNVPNMSLLFGLAGDLQSGVPEYLIIAFAAGEEAKGKYDVIDENDASTSSGKYAFLAVYDFKEGAANPKMFLSTEGSLIIQGGEITLDKIKLTNPMGGSDVAATGKLSCE